MEAPSDPCECLYRAQDGVIIGLVADLFASDCILLVGEGEVRVAHPHDDALVIQRCSRGMVASVFDVEFDVLEFEGFASSVPGAL